MEAIILVWYARGFYLSDIINDDRVNFQQGTVTGWLFRNSFNVIVRRVDEIDLWNNSHSFWSVYFFFCKRILCLPHITTNKTKAYFWFFFFVLYFFTVPFVLLVVLFFLLLIKMLCLFCSHRWYEEMILIKNTRN